MVGIGIFDATFENIGQGCLTISGGSASVEHNSRQGHRVRQKNKELPRQHGRQGHQNLQDHRRFQPPGWKVSPE